MLRVTLAEAAHARGLTFAQLAALVPIDRRTLRRWWDNRVRQAQLVTLARLCQALKCGTGDLLQRQEATP
jgi:DNA-binding Xre family transcriptional regulator